VNEGEENREQEEGSREKGAGGEWRVLIIYSCK